MIKLGVSGACGKMGKRIIDLARTDKDFKLVCAIEHKDHPQIGSFIGDVMIETGLDSLRYCDCLIEFTSPLATVEHLDYLVKFRKPAVIGTTGLNEGEEKRVKEAAKYIPIVFSPNMSVGVNLIFKIVRIASKILKNYKVYIEEAHHIHKKDAPSGTAKKIAQIVKEEGFIVDSKDIKSIREDEIVGDHRVIFDSELDRIEIFHSAKTRDIFAQGALLAAKWVVDKKPGLYSMDDVIQI
ncbi:MAG: 4-hydroxy-tetrahydrodipicolinate reductase [Candidatus Omnitrophica bacterium]|nr:4-hydroxy-tetrahydrodipicolinate reductase [Candidatus Omnitrophota bacterium]MCM8825946.1 4-hydroxy-tetrahydrodipicolinate reductase [Candidatus Omnitrophota bacterium]